MSPERYISLSRHLAHHLEAADQKKYFDTTLLKGEESLHPKVNKHGFPSRYPFVTLFPKFSNDLPPDEHAQRYTYGKYLVALLYACRDDHCSYLQVAQDAPEVESNVESPNELV